MPCQTSAGSTTDSSATDQPSGRSGNIRTSRPPAPDRPDRATQPRAPRVAPAPRSGFVRQPDADPDRPAAPCASPVAGASWAPPSAECPSWSLRRLRHPRRGALAGSAAQPGDRQPPVEVGADQPVAVAVLNRWLAGMPAAVHRDRRSRPRWPTERPGTSARRTRRRSRTGSRGAGARAGSGEGGVIGPDTMPYVRGAARYARDHADPAQPPRRLGPARTSTPGRQRPAGHARARGASSSGPTPASRRSAAASPRSWPR